MYTRSLFNFRKYYCLILLFIMGGCGTLPDLEPLARSTNDLYNGVTAIYADFRSQMLEGENDSEDILEKFNNNHWQKRVAAMEALVEYTNSLSGIAASGRRGRENAQALSKSLASLFSVMNASNFIGKEVFDEGTELYGAIAEAAAVHSLSKAVKAADPVITEITKILANDVTSLIGPIITSEAPLLLKLRTDDDTKSRLIVYNDLAGIRNTLLKDIIAHGQARPDADDAVKIEKWRLELGELVKVYEQISLVLEESNEWYEDYLAEVERIKFNVKYQVKVLTKLSEGFIQLQKTHNEIARALNENRTPNVRLLINTTLNIKMLIEESRENE